MTTPESTEVMPVEGQVIQADDPQAISESTIPYFADNTKKTKYLSYRACGFTIREALSLVGISERTRLRYREHDSRFKSLDDNIQGLRTDLANKYVELEFLRNFRLVLQLDFSVLDKEVKGELMTEREVKWLNKTRQNYTPQQLEAIQRVLGEGGGDGQFDFTEMILGLRRKGASITVHATTEE